MSLYGHHLTAGVDAWRKLFESHRDGQAISSDWIQLVVAVSTKLGLAILEVIKCVDGTDLLSSLQEPFEYGKTYGVAAGHESLRCLSHQLPRWIVDPYWFNKVSGMLHCAFCNGCMLINCTACAPLGNLDNLGNPGPFAMS